MIERPVYFATSVIPGLTRNLQKVEIADQVHNDERVQICNSSMDTGVTRRADILSLLPEEIDLKNHPAYRAKQVWGWLHKQHVTSFDAMQNIPKVMREELASSYYIAAVKEEKRLASANDGTIKFLHSLTDGALIESVLMEYSHGNTVCISTQVGCRMGCAFCASAIGGLNRNLTAGEMCTQVYSATQSGKRIGGVVLMGTGEPLDNYDATLQFIKLISHPDGLNIGQRHITLSTCGLVPQIIKLAEEKLQITLAISLHAATDETRQKLMPIAKKYPLKELMDACRYYLKQTNRRLTFEYALVKGENDRPAHASDIIKLLRGINCHVNLIPINKARGEFTPTQKKEAANFAVLLQKAGIQTTLRRSLGSDVNAACGQLRAEGVLDDKN